MLLNCYLCRTTELINVKKLHLLIIRSYIGPAIATFFISVFVLLMQFLWRYVDDLVGKGLEWNIIVQLLFYASFTFVPMALPLSILLSSLMTFGNLGERYELVAIKAAGISLRKVITPLAIFAFIVSVGAFYYSNIVFPFANLKFRTILYDVRQKKMALNIREGIWYSGLEGFVIKVGKKDPDKVTLRKLMIYDHTKFQGNNKLTIADSGRMEQTADGNFLLLTLYNGNNYEEKTGRNSQIKRPFERTSFGKEVIKFDLSQFKMSRTNDEFFRSAYYMLNVKQLDYAADSLSKEVTKKGKDLVRSISSYYPYLAKTFQADNKYKKFKAVPVTPPLEGRPKDEQKRIVDNALTLARNMKGSFEFTQQSIKETIELEARYKIEWHRKFTLSLACLALFLIGAPLGTIIRKGGLGMPLVVSVLLFVAYHVISFTGEKAARSGVTESWQGMWISTLVFLPIGVFLTYKAATDSALLDAEKYKLFINRFARFLGKKKNVDNEIL
jgi:lipopolysaccharide export system permease protein